MRLQRLYAGTVAEAKVGGFGSGGFLATVFVRELLEADLGKVTDRPDAEETSGFDICAPPFNTTSLDGRTVMLMQTAIEQFWTGIMTLGSFVLLGAVIGLVIVVVQYLRD